ncbi:MAG TPA: hypothetical protein VI318_07260 [Baekduia sp.]
MHGHLHRFGLLTLTVVALAAPATASADGDLTVGDAPTSGVATTTVDGLTTFRSTGPQPATLAAAEVNAELAAVHDVAIVDEGDEDLGGTVHLAAPLSGAGRSLSVEAWEGYVDVEAAVTAASLSLDGGSGVAGSGVRADRTSVHSGGRIDLDGDNHFGRLELSQDMPDDFTRVDDAGSLTLGPSRVAGGLSVLASGDLALAGDLVTGGGTLLVAHATPSRPVDDGDFTAAPGVRIDAGGHPVAIHSAHRRLDRLGPGLTINGAPYVPGPAFVRSASERWGQRWVMAADVAPYRFDFEEADTIKPTAELAFMVTAAPYFDLNEVVRFTHSCQDLGGSGLVSCTTNQHPDGTVDTSKLGNQLATVTATDAAGNTYVASRRYFVRPAPKPCVTPTSVTLKIERPKGTRSVVATLGGKRQKVKLSTTRVQITVDVRGRARGTYPLKVTIRRTHGRKTVTRRPKVTVYKCVGPHGG